MCGICGILHLSPKPDQPAPDAALLRRMSASLAHRGPDGEGYHHAARIGLGFRRLAIIDLHSGDQPIYSEDRQVVTVFNGEIYNYRALRQELQAAGHVFCSQTDTEVLVHGYEAWGLGLLSRLRGMYAFALWDARQERLLLVRDRQGQKPLYYAQVGESLYFASEIKALLQEDRLQPRLNQDALPEYLTLGYTLPPNTLFAGIHKLAPGSYLLIEKDGHIHSEDYWQPHFDTRPPQDAPSALRAMLEAVVDMQMMSDVPLGSFLSGGIDSTIITGLAAQRMEQPINSFTVGFDYAAGSAADQKFNVDLYYARQAAAAIGSQHHEIVLPEAPLLAALLPQLVYALDEPVAEVASVQTAFVAALARSSGIPVLLSGDGSDEIFAGYNFFQQDMRVSQFRRWTPARLRPFLETVAGHLPSRYSRLHKLAAKALPDNPAARFLSWEAYTPALAVPALLRDGAHAQARLQALQQKLNQALLDSKAPTMTDAVGYGKQRWWLPEDSNMRMDKIAMWMSVEARSPFQDHLLVALALGLPLRQRIGKRVLKSAAADLLPRAILQRPKWGFMPPTSGWLRTALRPLLQQYLSPERLEASGLNPAPITALLEAHLSGQGYHMLPLWSLLVLQLWHALYIDRSLSLPSRWSAEEVAALGLVNHLSPTA